MWTVPKSVLRLVALILFGCAVGAFALGILGAEPGGGRLPGETASTEGATVTTVNAADARPLTEGGAPPARDQDQQAAAEDDSEEAETEVAEATDAPADPQIPALQVPVETAAPRPPPAKAPPPKTPSPPPQQSGDAIGDLVDGLTPPSELPPF